MNCFPYKETHFFDFIQFLSFIAQLCNLVAHPVGTCKILLVEASSNSNANLAAAVNEAAKLGATEISNSYGGSESSGRPPTIAAIRIQELR